MSGHELETTHGDIRCIQCEYSLFGLETHRCPECGRPFDPADAKTFHFEVLDGRQYLRWCGWSLAGILLPLVLLCLGRLFDTFMTSTGHWMPKACFAVALLVGGPYAFGAWVSSFGLASMGRQALIRRRCPVQHRNFAWAGFVVTWLIAFAPLALLTASRAILLW